MQVNCNFGARHGILGSGRRRAGVGTVFEGISIIPARTAIVGTRARRVCDLYGEF